MYEHICTSQFKILYSALLFEWNLIFSVVEGNITTLPAAKMDLIYYNHSKL